MTERRGREPSTPGTWCVIAVLAAALLGVAWRGAARVPVGGAAAPGPRLVMRLDLNRASAAELTALPGIGPQLAGRIVARRERYGPFTSVEDLQRVAGVGPATADRISPHVVAELGSPQNSEAVSEPPPVPDRR